jgi:uncharacterized membrane protein YdjX (TVP38/TMEM64 family)
VAVLVGAIGLLYGVWHYTPLTAVLRPAAVARFAREVAGSPWAPLIVVAVYTPASLVLFPRTLLNISSVVAFGPWRGAAYSLVGILIAALVTYLVGRLAHPRSLRRLAGRKIYRVSRTVRHAGVAGITALRLVPVAPFPVINAIAGAVRVRVFEFLLGTALGMVPGLTGAAIIGTGLREALEQPRDIDWPLIVVVAAVAFAASLLLTYVLRAARPVRSALDSEDRH